MITASWAWAARTWVLAWIDPAAARRASAALAEAREIDYPVAVAVDLRTKAFAHLLLEDPESAAETVGELLDDLLERVLVEPAHPGRRDGRNRVLVVELPSWQQLAATARALPITTLASSQFEVIAMPPVEVTPLTGAP